MKTIAILQSNYIPWKGYFDIIQQVDEFILYDDIQYTKNDWRNRNKVMSATGPIWLTIPVRQEKLAQKINETQIADHRWVDLHLKSLQSNYAKAPHFQEYSSRVFELYEQCRQENLLSRINRIFLEGLAALLGINTLITSSADYHLDGGQTERLVNLCLEAGGTSYLSGPAAKAYLQEELFRKKCLELHWMDYSGYPAYPQRFSQPFEHGLSVLDLIFNTGPEAPWYIWGWRRGAL